MFYVKEKLGENLEVKVDITYDNVFCRCPICGAETKVYLDDILQDSEGGIEDTAVCCDKCSENYMRRKFHGHTAD